ncbi:MAG: hypothetical protein KGL39_58050 [Patescibacteria group bacterium]|nr:hypothetical protein [Patescibacteria group bacterium]
MPTKTKKPKLLTAYCYASGRIEFGQREPRGAITIVRGPEAAVRKHVGVLARESRPDKPGGKTHLLVHGIPESSDQQEGMTALIQFRKQVNLRLRRDLFTPEHQSAARREGWDVFTVNSTKLQIQRNDEMDAFDSDAHAIEHVLQNARYKEHCRAAITAVYRF